MTVVDTPSEIENVRRLTVAHGLELYAKTGMLPSRMWKPMRMLMVASEITGKAYKRGEYLRAAADIRSLLP